MTLLARMLVLSLVLAGVARGEDARREFAYAVPLTLEAEAPFYRTDLTVAVYEGLVRADLGDLRVLNGNAEVVPHAFEPVAPAPAARSLFSAPIFPLAAGPESAIESLALTVESRPDGTILRLSAGTPGSAGGRLLGYLADLSASADAIRAIELERPAGAAPFSGQLNVEASDDLKAWIALARHAPVLSLATDAARLERLRIEFPAHKAKYLRLSWPSRSTPVELAGIRAERAVGADEPVRIWKTTQASPARERPDEYLFPIVGRYPADRLRVRLPQTNTVANAEFLTRAQPSDPWRPIARATVYRLRIEGADVDSPEFAIGGAPQRELLMRVDAKGGGVGVGMPVLELGWVPHRLVFAARGPEPFRIAFGSRTAPPAAYSIDTLVPGYHAESEAGERMRQSIRAARPGAPATLAGAAALERPIDLKRWTLWGTLAAAVAVLGFMAWRLSRPGRARPPADDRPKA